MTPNASEEWTASATGLSFLPGPRGSRRWERRELVVGLPRMDLGVPGSDFWPQRPVGLHKGEDPFGPIGRLAVVEELHPGHRWLSIAASDALQFCQRAESLAIARPLRN